MWIALWLGCMSAPVDSGWGTPPVWSGTQIGEEGDECEMEIVSWDDADPALTERLSSMLNTPTQGSLDSVWQGVTDATMTLTGGGGAYREPTDETCGEPELILPVQLDVSGPPLLESTASGFVTVRAATAVLDVEFNDPGALDPGVLPDDAGAITLLAESSHPDVLPEIDLVWHLQRTEHQEVSPAATFTAD